MRKDQLGNYPIYQKRADPPHVKGQRADPSLKRPVLVLLKLSKNDTRRREEPSRLRPSAKLQSSGCTRPRATHAAVHGGWKVKSLHFFRRITGDDEKTGDDRALMMAHWHADCSAR
ncbi:Acetyl-coenzyme A synthetase [Gossypium arboreum]|uniref:Acetyl-coenzyme A synthetase n=1 Tax=Gossypium arboreum TaxID=29729 RepID=A0A0B0PRJ9_GOSAR|nr:Acetyl-coenzyme A synthetase [Gossypium arboreum]